MAGRRCSNCTAIVPKGRRTCSWCGYPVAPGIPPVWPVGSAALPFDTPDQPEQPGGETIPALEVDDPRRLSMKPDTTNRHWIPAGSELHNGAPPMTRATTNTATAPYHASPQYPDDPAVRPARDRRRRRIGIMIAAPVVLVLLIAGAAAYGVIQVFQAFETINSISTPADSISGASLGGSADVTIDTGPAQTAVAGGGSSARLTVQGGATEPPVGNVGLAAATESPSVTPQPPAPTRTSTRSAGGGSVTDVRTTPTVRVIKSPTPTPGPGDGLVSPPPAATSTPAPTDTPSPASSVEPSPTATESPTAEPSPTQTATPETVLSEIERVRNGGFEEGETGWHLEEGASVTTADAHRGSAALTIDERGGWVDQRVFFVPETTYRLSAVARTTEANAEQAEVGIAYVDADGNRLRDLEPPAQTVTRTRWQELTIEFTVPPGVAEVQVYFWKPAGTARLLVDTVSIRSIVPPDALAIELQDLGVETMTVLFMGVDARPGEAIDGAVRPDSLMVVHLNSDTGSCRLLSIPRDTRAELPGYGPSKINHALAVGGIEYQMLVVELLTGLRLDHYVLLDFNGFEDLVDAAGGVTVTIPAGFVATDGTEFVAGEQKMSGKQALSYARWRGGADGDFGRIQRQQLIIRALIKRATSLDVIASINELLPAVEQNLRTDLSPTEMASIAGDFQSRCTEETVTLLNLEGGIATLDDPLLHMPLSYVIVDEAEVRRKVAALVEP